MASSAYAAAVLADSPTQYFELNDSTGPTAYDSSNTATNGTYVGAVTFGASGPLLDENSTAISVPGGSASVGVSLPNPNASTGKSYSIQTWVDAMPSSNYMTIWGAGGRHRLLVSAAGLLLSQFNGNFFSKTALSRNQWHDVVFVYDAVAATASYYIDGQFDSSAPLSNSYAAFASTYYLGQYDTSVNYKWHGSMAQHAFYATALSASQIAQLHSAAGYAAPSQSSSPTPVPTLTSPTPVPTLTPTPAPTQSASPTPAPTLTPTPVPTQSASPTPAPPGTTVTIPFWQSSFTYAGKTYSYKMVGSNPMTSPASTIVSDQIVPVELVFSDGTTLDPTTAAAGMPASPLFANGSYAAGVTQYGDALMRSEFWKYAANENYHVLLAPPVVEPTVQVTVPAADGYTTTGANGQKTGYVTFAWFMQTIEPQIIQQLAINPNSLTLFATNSTKVLEQSGHCCYAGYHYALQMSTIFGASIATTAWASVTTTSVETMSHEVAEWLNDPFYTNHVPSWINPISKACNGTLLEVGDPVTNYSLTVNGYSMQDEVFYSWFSRDVPSIGINGQYDLTGNLSGPAISCS